MGTAPNFGNLMLFIKDEKFVCPEWKEVINIIVQTLVKLQP